MSINLDDEIALYWKKVNFYKDYPVTNDIMVRELKIFLVLLEQLKNERPKGEWKYTTHYGRRYRVCPFCTTEREDDHSTGWNFCCYCGADMRGGRQ